MARPPRLRTRGPEELRHRAFDYRPPRFLAAIRYGLMSTVAVAVMAVAFTAYWYVTAANLRDGTVRWFAERRAEGMEAAYERLTLAGFPGSIRVEVAAPQLAARLDPRPWHWRSDAAALQVRPWNLRRARLEIAGMTEVGFVAAGAARRYAGDAGAFALELAWFGDGRPRAFAAAIDGLGLDAVPKRDGATSDRIAAGQLRFDGKDFDVGTGAGYHEATFAVSGTGNALSLPAFLASPLGQTIAELAITARLFGPLRLDDVEAGLAEWRDGGGTVEIDSFEARHGPLHVRANGTLALDAALQPVGAVTAKIAGFFETIDAFQRANLLRSRNAAMAKVVLGALAKRSVDGGPPTLSIPVTIQDGKIFAGPVTLAELPRVVWPASAEPRLRILR
jgi:hypothetical protein